MLKWIEKDVSRSWDKVIDSLECSHPPTRRSLTMHNPGFSDVVLSDC